MPYPTLADLRLRADTAGLTDDALSTGLRVAIETVESACGRTFGNTIDPATGLIRVVETPSSIAMVVSGLASYNAANLWSRVPDRATSVTTDMGVVNISMPDASKGRFTGIPDYDTILTRFRFSTPSAW